LNVAVAAFTPFNTLWPQLLRRARRRFRTAPLFVSVASAVLVGAGLIWLGFSVFEHVVGVDATKHDSRGDVLKIALSTVAGVGGAVALVVAYRRQRDLEEGRFIERFGSAAAQLGDPDPAVRIAGVYALARTADETTVAIRSQQCVEVLCGYLRLPYYPDEGSSHVTEVVTTTTLAERVEQARHQTIRHNDRQVRQTIVRVIAAHLREDAENSWSAHDFDFEGAWFEDAGFNDVIFAGPTTSFIGATFTGATLFDKARFKGERAWFQGATFDTAQDSVTFRGAHFLGATTSFRTAEFAGRSASFKGAQFLGGEAEFDEVKFHSTDTLTTMRCSAATLARHFATRSFGPYRPPSRAPSSTAPPTSITPNLKDCR
jgi:hypothetical protein